MWLSMGIPLGKAQFNRILLNPSAKPDGNNDSTLLKLMYFHCRSLH